MEIEPQRIFGFLMEAQGCIILAARNHKRMIVLQTGHVEVYSEGALAPIVRRAPDEIKGFFTETRDGMTIVSMNFKVGEIAETCIIGGTPDEHGAKAWVARVNLYYEKPVTGEEFIPPT